MLHVYLIAVNYRYRSFIQDLYTGLERTLLFLTSIAEEHMTPLLLWFVNYAGHLKMTVKNADLYIALVRILVFTYIAYIASSNVSQLCIFTHMYLQVAFEPMHTRVHIHIHAWDRHKINIIFHTNIVLKDTRMQYFNVAYDLEFVSHTLPWFFKDTRAIWYTAGSSKISTQVVPLADILLCTSYNNMNWIIHT